MLVAWKGARVSKVQFTSETGGILLRVNFFNDAPGIDVVNGKYLGFLGFPKRKCGIDFIDAFIDGRIRWELFDSEAYYTPQYVYKRRSGQHTSVMLQIYRHRF